MKVFLERFWQDLYHGCRMLAKNPAFTVVAVISLAIGIGANCAMYSWADALLLRPLPVARPGDVISVGTKVTLAGFSSLVNSYPGLSRSSQSQSQLRRSHGVHRRHSRVY